MNSYLLAAFFLLFGVMNVTETKIPAWVLGASALVVALDLIKSALEAKK